MTVDVIMLSLTKFSDESIVTETAIRSLRACETESLKFNIVLYEGNPKVLFDEADRTEHYDFDFNYNRLMNQGIQSTSNDFVIMTNNDVLFINGFWDEMLKGFENFDSLSPNDPSNLYESDAEFVRGYGIGKELRGYCIAVKRKALQKIGNLDEGVRFWYSDNIYADQLKKAKLSHAISLRSYVYHLNGGSQTVKGLEKRERVELRSGQKPVYDEAKKKYKL